ncbi:hypothetical protein [Achromobacter insolitus]|uniref:hypothetical protein n=1 Tax=Achromobacter insolitus TaxID=217204 RepID=UPI0013AF5A43|nr:hypothetical protein [Achromobacter insolitus]MCP1402825.1 hypothetical protein [Achromobacter insolitus]
MSRIDRRPFDLDRCGAGPRLARLYFLVFLRLFLLAEIVVLRLDIRARQCGRCRGGIDGRGKARHDAAHEVKARLTLLWQEKVSDYIFAVLEKAV